MPAVAPAMSAPAPDLAVQIETEHQAALDAANTADHARQTALRHAFACGNLLIEAKAQVEVAGGSWGEWVKAHLSFGERQAQKYRRFASAVRVKPELLTSHSTLDSALNSIAEPKSGSGSKSALKSEGPKPTSSCMERAKRS